MKRREFLLSGAALLMDPLEDCLGAPHPQSPSSQADAVDIYSRLVRANDALVPSLLERQEQRAGHRWLGGVPDTYGIHTPGGTASLIRTLAAAYCAPESRYKEAREFIPRLELAARYLLAAQHSDGTIDLYTTNFHSPPDTGFVVEALAPAVAVLRKRQSPALVKTLGDLDRFLMAAGDAMAVGGIHTPNHRWVVCAALARIHSLYPNKKYVARIDDWLGEGIDIDPDGQFTERSTSIYSPVVDRSLLTVARLLDRPQLIDPVRRNLDMTLYYLHADGEAATEGSRRQDQYARGSTSSYYISYRYLAIKERNGSYAAMTRRIEEINGDGLAGNLIYFLEEPMLRGVLPPAEKLPDDYVKHYAHSGLVRIRRGLVSATILANNPTFFSFHKGAAALQALRFASAFFGKGQFVGAGMQLDGTGYGMQQSLTGPYYQPIAAESRRSDGDWTKMPPTLRRQTEVQQMQSSVRVTEQGGRFEVAIDIDGCERVPVAVEFVFRRGGVLSGVTPVAGIPDAYLLERGVGRYEFEGQVIEFGPGQMEHGWTQLRGALPKMDSLSVYVTGFTPFRRRFSVA